jgi:multidrug efflux pump subunit AcrA (membrane-fusion protein)
MWIKERKSIAMLGLATLVAGAFMPSLQAQQKDQPTVIRAFTQASETQRANFPNMGVVKQIPVKKGQTVKVGDVVMIQDDELNQYQFQQAKLEAESGARIDFAVADLEFKKAQVTRTTTAAPGIFSAIEKEQAQLDQIRSEKQLDVTKLDQESNKLKARAEGAKLEQMKIKSNIDGVVESINVYAGELATPQADKPVIVIVKNDPCKVILNDLTTKQVARLSLGETFEVKYPDDREWRPAKVTFISPVANAGADVQKVELELPNPEGKATGLPIQVKLPAKLANVDAENNAAVLNSR